MDFKNFEALSLKVSEKALAIFKYIYVRTFSFHTAYPHRSLLFFFYFFYLRSCNMVKKRKQTKKLCSKSIYQEKYVKLQIACKTGKLKV